MGGTGCAYVVGYTLSNSFPTVSALQPNYAGGKRDGFIARIGLAKEHERVALEVARSNAGRQQERQATQQEDKTKLPASVAGLAAVVDDRERFDRRAAVLKLGRMEGKAKDAIPALIRALEDADLGVRYRAAVALVRVGGDSDSLIPVLLEGVRASRMGMSTEAASAAWALGLMKSRAKEAVPAMVGELQDNPRAPRPDLIRALGEIGAAAEDAGPALTEALQDEDSQTRYRAAVALVRIGGDADSAVPVLIEALREPSHSLRSEVRWAIWMLGEMGSGAREAVPAMARELANKRGRHLLLLIAALGKIGPEAKEAIPSLRAIMEKRTLRVRYQTAAALAGMGAPVGPLLPILTDALQSRSPNLASARWTARQALWKLGAEAAPAVPGVAEMIRNQSTPGRDLLIDTLARLGPHAKQAIPALQSVLDDPDAKIGALSAAALVLAGADPGPLFPRLLEVIRSGSKDMQSGAVWASHALTELGPDAAPVLSAIIEELPKQRGLVLLNLTETLGKIGPSAREAVPVLRGLLKDEDEEVRGAAEKALGRIEGDGTPGA